MTIKAYIFESITPLIFSNNFELIEYMMSKSFEKTVSEYMEGFSRRTNGKIKCDTIDNFINTCHKYGYIKILENSSCV